MSALNKDAYLRGCEAAIRLLRDEKVRYVEPKFLVSYQAGFQALISLYRDNVFYIERDDG